MAESRSDRWRMHRPGRRGGRGDRPSTHRDLAPRAGLWESRIGPTVDIGTVIVSIDNADALSSAALDIGSGSNSSGDALGINGTTPTTQYDILNATAGTLNLGRATPNVRVGFIPAIGNMFQDVNNATSANVGNVEIQASYRGGPGDDVVLTVTEVSDTRDGCGVVDDDGNTAANGAPGRRRRVGRSAAAASLHEGRTGGELVA